MAPDRHFLPAVGARALPMQSHRLILLAVALEHRVQLGLSLFHRLTVTLFNPEIRSPKKCTDVIGILPQILNIPFHVFHTGFVYPIFHILNYLPLLWVVYSVQEKIGLDGVETEIVPMGDRLVDF